MMSKRILITLMCAIAACYVAGCSSAKRALPGSSDPVVGQAVLREKPVRVERHFYAVTGVGVSRVNPDASEVRAFTVNDRVEAGGQITVGADLSRQLAIELHSADLGSAGFDPGGRLNYHIAGASALFYAGKNRHNYKRRGLTGYGRLGVGILENTPVGNIPFVTDNDTHVLFGAGIEYMTNIGLGVRAEGIAFEEDAQFAQLGLIYRTGGRANRKPVKIAVVPTSIETAAAAPAPISVNACATYSGVIEGVNFHSNSARLTAKAMEILDSVVDSLATCITAPVGISAHTDSIGAAKYNESLSGRRARSVAIYLGKRGIDTSRMTIKTFGETQPIDNNNTVEGRNRNRRVELIAK